MFKGFNVKYPEYEVITPHTNKSFHVRSLNVQEEERLKGSLLTPAKINDHLNKCIFEAISKKPKEIINYDSFLKNTTLKDRDALLYGLYHITYEEIRNYDVKCGVCKKDYPVTVKASSTFNYNSYPDNDILTREIKVPLKVTDGVFAIIKQPTLFDEMITYANFGPSAANNMDILTETLIIKRFEQLTDSGENIVYDNREDVIDAYKSLPSKDKREIYSSYRDNFGQYGIILKMKTNCIHCGTESVIDIDLVENFFRMVHSF